MVRPTGRYGVDETVSLSLQVLRIIDDIQSGLVSVPDYFNNSIQWVETGHMTETEFMNSYNYLLSEGIIHPYVSTELPSPPEPTPEPLKEYWVAKPSQIDTSANYPLPQNFRAEIYRISDKLRDVWLSQGYILSDTEPAYQSGKTLWQGVTLFGKGICTNKSGERYTQVIPCIHQTPPSFPAEEPEVEPEVPEQMVFLCSDVYTLDNGSVVKTNYPTLSVPQIQNFISQGLMVRDCGTPSPTVNEVRSHYGYVPEVPVEEEPAGPEVETTEDIPPPTDEEPEQMEFLCSDVYTLDNGSVVKTNYPTLSVPQIQNFISQGLMVRECGTSSPTVNEVRSHYGYVPGPVETVPTEKFVVSKPGRLTMSDMTNTNAWVGVLTAGVLAVPVFSSILSKRK